MSNRLVPFTPKGTTVTASLTEGIVISVPFNEWEMLDATFARNNPNRPPDFDDNVKRFWNGETVDLAKDGQIRIGCGMAVYVMPEAGYIMGQYDDGHPQKGLQVTPPSGIPTSRDEAPDIFAFREFSEEALIAAGQVNIMGLAEYNGICFPEHAKRWAKEHNFAIAAEPYQLKTISPNGCIPITIGDKSYTAAVAFESAPASMELIFFAEAVFPERTMWETRRYFDGETLPNGEFRNSKVYVFPKQTEKAVQVMNVGFDFLI